MELNSAGGLNSNNFTHGEQLEGKTVEEFMEDCSQLKELVDKCGGRCHVIDNKYWNKRKRGYKSNRVQVKNLLKTIDEMVKESGCDTNELLKKLEEEIQKEMKNTTENNLHAEEQARQNVHSNFLKKCVGVSTGVVLGALFGMGFAVPLVMTVLKFYVTTGFTAAYTAAGVGAGAAAAAGAKAKGVLVTAGFLGGVGSIFNSWNAEPESTKAAVDTLENGLSMVKKAEDMCTLNSKMATLH